MPSFAQEDDSVRVLLVTGAGKAFYAGMYLSIDSNVFGLDRMQAPTLHDMLTRLDDPAIGRGVRHAGGRVTLAMDFRLASTKARIGFVFGRLRIVPEACSTWFLPRIVGLQTALEWVYRADILALDEAKEPGLARSIHEPDALLAKAEAFARLLVEERSPVAIAFARAMLYRNAAAPHPIDAHRIVALAMFATSIADGKEGVAAFTGGASAMPAMYDEWLAQGGD